MYKRTADCPHCNQEIEIKAEAWSSSHEPCPKCGQPLYIWWEEDSWIDEDGGYDYTPMLIVEKDD
jgi:peptide subunit release factor 1 (eRF1)